MSNPVTDQKISVSPAYQFASVTPDDDNDLSISARSLYVGSGGDISVLNSESSAVVFKNVPDGSFLPVNTTRVKATDTTAQHIIAIY